MDITPVIELLNNFLYIASAYNQIWTIKVITLSTSCGIAFVDERSGEVKMTFHNPDEKMLYAASEIRKKGWAQVKKEYLMEPMKFNEARIHLCEKECNSHSHS